MKKTFYFYEGGGGNTILIKGTFDKSQHFLKGAVAPPVAVYLPGCQGARFLLCLRRLIPKCLWQVDESVSYGHLSLYPTCQSGEWIVHPIKDHLWSRSLETLEERKAKRTQVKKHQVMLHYDFKKKKKNTLLFSAVGIAQSCGRFHTCSLCDMVSRSLMRLSRRATVHLDRPARAAAAVIKTICYRPQTHFSADVSNFKSRAPRPDLSNLGVPVHKHGRQTDYV